MNIASIIDILSIIQDKWIHVTGVENGYNYYVDNRVIVDTCNGKDSSVNIPCFANAFNLALCDNLGKMCMQQPLFPCAIDPLNVTVQLKYFQGECNMPQHTFIYKCVSQFAVLFSANWLSCKKGDT